MSWGLPEEDKERLSLSFLNKKSWNLEEDFVKEYEDENGNLVRRNDKEELHSLLSPAIEFSDGNKDWYYEDEWYGDSRNGYNQEQFLEDLRREGKIASQKLSWGEEDFVKEYKDEYDDLVRRNDKGELHSLYSPAIEFSEGDKYWYQNGKLHRLDGPAKEHPDGHKEWYYDDNWYGDSRNGYTQEKFEEDLRNEGKIASQKLAWGEDFTQEYKDEYDDLVRRNDKGELHSLYSPALISHGNKWWYKNGKVHRLDGPAAEYGDGNKVWWYEGKKYGLSIGYPNSDVRNGYTQEQFIEDLKKDGKIASMKLGWGEEEDFTEEYKDEYDDLVRRNDKGLFHSLYSPAIEFSEGDKYWYQNGKLHRLDGPAKEHPDGHKEWYYDDNWYGDSRNGYTQEKFEEDLRKDGKIASMKQGSDELFICLWAPDDVYTKFPNVDDELHVTLIYRKDITSSPDLSESLLKFIGNICDEVGTVKCKATGIGTFNNDSKSDAVLINIVKGASLYEKLRSLVESIYGKWDIDYGYLPHMTLKYKGTGKVSLKKFKPFSWNVRHIGVRIGEDNYLVNVKTGEYKKTKKILSSLEDSSNTLEFILPEDSNSFVNPKEDRDIRRVNNKRYDKITDIYDTSNSEISNRTDNPIIGIASQKLAWDEEGFTKEYKDEDGNLIRKNDKGQLHSLYSPAIEWSSGTKEWCQNGKFHRLDGPAVEYPDGSKVWWYENNYYGSSYSGYSQEQFEEDLRNEGKIASQKLAWGVSQEDQIKDMLLESIDWSKVANLIELYYQELLQVDSHASYYDAIDLFLDYNLSSEDPTVSYRHLQESYPEIDPILWNKVFSSLLFQSIHLSFQKLSWGEEDFIEEEFDVYGNIYRVDKNGDFHSLYSPAVEYSNGYKAWYQNGKRHREDGPAIEYSDGDKEWYYEDKWYGCSNEDYTQEKFEEDLKKDGKIASMKLGWGEEEDFVKEHRNENGSIFRVFRENDKGEYHSLYSPAIEFSDGDKYWYQNGTRHRLDGPAVEYDDGRKAWYYEGREYGCSNEGYTQEKFEEDLRREGKIASQKLSWGEEDYVTEKKIEDGNIRRYNSSGLLHSLYSPARVYKDGATEWYRYGRTHRLDGPAFELSNGLKAWYYEGEFYGDNDNDYTQEKFEQDLRNKGKIASKKLSWGDFHDYVFTETISKSVMPSSIDHSREAQEELLKETLERVIQNNELDYFK